MCSIHLGYLKNNNYPYLPGILLFKISGKAFPPLKVKDAATRGLLKSGIIGYSDETGQE